MNVFIRGVTVNHGESIPQFLGHGLVCSVVKKSYITIVYQHSFLSDVEIVFSACN